MRNKKGDIAIAGGVLLLGMLFVGYLLFLPKDDKCNVLPDLPECNGSSNTTLTHNSFLSEKPGFLESIENETEYDIGTVELFNREVTELPLQLSGGSTVETVWFNAKKIEEEFSVPGKAKKVTLFLTIEQSNGLAALYVILNGKTVSRVVGAGTHIIDLPKDSIARENVLGFKASTPFLPGAKNTFTINSLILKETYELTQAESRRSFVLEQHVEDVKSAVLEFTADCYSTDPLRIILNNRTISEEKMCGDYSNDISDLLDENNKLVFSSDGNYFIHDVNIDVKFIGRDFTTYYFTLNKENFDRVKEGNVLAFLKLSFPDQTRKELTVYVNGNPIKVDTRKAEFKTAIGELLKQGQNAVRIKPASEVTISKLEVFFE